MTRPHAVPLEGDAWADAMESMREERDDAFFAGEPFPAPFAADDAWLDQWFIHAHAGMDYESGQIVGEELFAATERDYAAYESSSIWARIDREESRFDTEAMGLHNPI